MNEHQKLLPVGALFRETWLTYKSHFRALLIIVGIPIIISLIGGLALRGGTVFQMLGSIIILLSLILLIASFPAAVYVLKSGGHARSAYAFAFKKFVSYLWIIGLNSAIVLGGYVMGVIPGLIFGVWFTFAIYILIFEEKKGLEALLRSKEYVRGYFWSVVGRELLLLLFTVAVAYALAILVKIIVSAELTEMVISFIHSLFGIFISPFILAFNLRLYEELRALKPNLAQSPITAKRDIFIVSAFLGIIVPPLILAALFLKVS